MKVFSSALAIILIIFAVWSCKDSPVDDDDASRFVFPDSNVSYGTHVEPLFHFTCALTACHGADTYTLRGFSLDTYEHLMFGTRPVVLRGDPDNSPLVWRIEGRPGLVQMPFGRRPLNENQIRGIRTWIREGASDN